MSVVDFQAKRHWLVGTDEFYSETEYFLHLIHCKAYELAAELAGGPILDVGCNNGYGTAMLRAELQHPVIGVDVSERAIKAARARYGGDFRQVDGTDLPFPDQGFDMVTSFQVIEHIDGLEPYLSEIGRVLRPGGKALFTTPNASIRLQEGGEPWNRFHVQEFTADGLAESLRPYFSNVEVRGLRSRPELERLERARSTRLRWAGHVRALGAWFLPPVAEDWIINGIRRIQRIGRKPVGPEVTKTMSTADLNYPVGDADSGLNLLAICER